MFNLGNFYHSKQWEKLTTQIKAERVNEDGQLICWHCGKPIVKAYDCICHHTIFLTEENVNDYEVSLNPDLIQLVHHKCHNVLHNKLGHSKREVFLVYGSPLSGKSTWVMNNAQNGDLIIDIDNIWHCVSGREKYIKPGTLNAVVFSVRDCLMDAVKHRLGFWNCCYIVGGFPLISERERMIKEYGAREVYIESTKEECLARLEQCNDARDKKEWTKYINQWWQRYGG